MPLNNNWMHLKSDGTFNSYDGDSDTKEKGEWTYNTNENLLCINADSGHADDSTWILSLKNDTLIFSEKGGNMRLIARKMK